MPLVEVSYSLSIVTIFSSEGQPVYLGVLINESFTETIGWKRSCDMLSLVTSEF